MKLLNYFVDRCFRKENKMDVPLRGYVYLKEGAYPADVVVVEVKERVHLFSKEEQYIKYKIYPDTPIPVPADGGESVVYIWSKTVRAGGYKLALNEFSKYITNTRESLGKDGWDKHVEYDNGLLGSPLYGAEDLE